MDVSPRVLLPTERALIAGLLRHGALAEHHYHELDPLRVGWECDCGCSSVEFQFEGRPIVAPGEASILVDVYAVTPEGHNVGLILWGTSLQLTRLEVYSLDSDPPFALPNPDTITDDPPTRHWFDLS